MPGENRRSRLCAYNPKPAKSRGIGMDFMNAPIDGLAWTGVYMTPWKVIGMTGALMFGTRWLVQFLASRRAGRPVIPRLFWYMSLAGSAMTLAYFVFSDKQDAVGVLQNLFPAFTAAYSLWLDIRHHRGQVLLGQHDGGVGHRQRSHPTPSRHDDI